MFNLGKSLKFLGALLLYIPIMYAEPEPAHLIHAHNITRKFIRQAEETFNISCCATGGSMVHNIKELYISFAVYHQLSIDQARDLEVKLITMLLDIINSDELARPYLITYPFPIQDASVSLVILTDKHESVTGDQLAGVTFTRNIISYAKHEANSSRLEDLLQEPYEVAERLVRENKIQQPMERGLNEKRPISIVEESDKLWEQMKKKALQMFGKLD